MTATDPRSELLALAGVRVDAAWREPRPGSRRTPQGWQIAAAGRVWHLGSSAELRDPLRLNAWRNQVANCGRVSRDEPWETLLPLDRAQARRVVRLVHEIAETDA
jgi:hypothetical protein